MGTLVDRFDEHDGQFVAPHPTFLLPLMLMDCITNTLTESISRAVIWFGAIQAP